MCVVCGNCIHYCQYSICYAFYTLYIFSLYYHFLVNKVVYFNPVDFPTTKISTFWKSKMAAAAMLKNHKVATFQQQFDPSPQNLARWRTLTLLILRTSKVSTFWKSEIAAAAILKNTKIAISNQRIRVSVGIGLRVMVRDCLWLWLARPGGLPLGSATHC